MSMKLVILVAGKGTRMGELTKDTPKPMLRVSGKTLIEHKLDAVDLTQISEVILVVGYLQNVIRDYFGLTYKNIPVRYVEDTLEGTAQALWHCKDFLNNESFMVMMGDDIYHEDDVARVMQTQRGILFDTVKRPVKSGKVIIENNVVVDVIEGAELLEGDYINTALYHLTPEIFSFDLVKIKDREEFGLPQTLIAHAAEYPLTPVFATRWVQITAPEDIEKAEKEIEGEIQ